jgi:hypothetical protein
MDISNNSSSGYDSDDISDSFASFLTDKTFGIHIPSGVGGSIGKTRPELSELLSVPKSTVDSTTEFESKTIQREPSRHLFVTPILQPVSQSTDITMGREASNANSISGIQLPPGPGINGFVYVEMDTINQVKLSKSEWDYTEIPENQSEKNIMSMIIQGFHNVNIVQTTQQSLISFLKIQPSTEMHHHLYATFYQSMLEGFVKKHRKNDREHMARRVSIENGEGHTAANNTNTTSSSDVFQSWKRVMGETKTIKKIDAMRIQNIKMDTTTLENTYEHILLTVFDKMLEEKYYGTLGSGDWVQKRRLKWTYYYYTLCILYGNNISNLNINVDSFISHVITWYENEAVETTSVEHFVSQAYEYIERNEYIHKYASMQLYDHQKQLFTVIKDPNPKLILYIAPTGTGKTLSPLGITEKFRVVFICAARHVGIALAKSAITMKKKVAFAFGCNNIDDIRLHYFSAKEYTRDWKTGGIRKVDNSVGDNVELMICDVKSYLYAMHYMCAFNPVDKLVMYWDEPTIMMDYKEHPYHSVIHKTWCKNIIPNIVLSSATLPKEHEISNVILDFKTKFSNSPQIYNIVSHDCKKSIPILNKMGNVELPHFLFSNDYSKLKDSAKHCQQYKTIMRYFDVREVIRFICAVNDKNNKNNSAHGSVQNKILTSQRYSLTRYFSDKLTDVTLSSLKEYYLKLIDNVCECAWKSIIHPLIETRTPFYTSTIYFTTKDAHTLTDGPTIYLTNDVKKVSAFALQYTEIPDKVFDDIMSDITFNAALSEKIATLEQQLEDERAKREGSGTSNSSSGSGSLDDKGGRSVSKKTLDSKLCINEKSSKVMKRFDELFSLQSKISELKEQVKTVTLNEIFIPNTDEHFQYWRSHSKTCAGAGASASANVGADSRFSSDVDPETVEQIMLLPIDNSWKLLLLMGIGVITNPYEIGASNGSSSVGTQYNDIIKMLAQNQRLYLIIASSDYIYGTNYQFCHGYIGKDLSDMTQEKTIQAMGRVGRNNLQQDYTIRFRDDDLIKKLFLAIPSDEKIEVINMNKLFTTTTD